MYNDIQYNDAQLTMICHYAEYNYTEWRVLPGANTLAYSKKGATQGHKLYNNGSRAQYHKAFCS
jgi:hypothetical protein